MKMRVRPDRTVRMADFRPSKVAAIELALGRSKTRNSEELSDLRELWKDLWVFTASGGHWIATTALWDRGFALTMNYLFSPPLSLARCH